MRINGVNECISVEAQTDKERDGELERLRKRIREVAKYLHFCF